MRFGDISDVKTMHEGKVVKHVRSYTVKVRLKDTTQLRNEIFSLIEDVSAGKCLDFSVDVMVDSNKKPKWLTKTVIDPCSKMRM